MGVLTALALFLRSWFIPRANLACENLALRQQLSIYKHGNKRPKLRARHRVFWTWLRHFGPDWRSALVIVKPETVIRWHRQ